MQLDVDVDGDNLKESASVSRSVTPSDQPCIKSVTCRVDSHGSAAVTMRAVALQEKRAACTSHAQY